jgi:hypothetical protein
MSGTFCKLCPYCWSYILGTRRNDKGPKQARKQVGKLMVMWAIWGRRDPDRVLLKNLNEGYHIRDLGIDGRVILKWILKN